MNLKKFHLVFIACAAALSFLFGAWARGSQGMTGWARPAAAGGAFLVGLALIAYEAWFLRYTARQR